LHFTGRGKSNNKNIFKNTDNPFQARILALFPGRA